jgi:hypothetical protein
MHEAAALSTPERAGLSPTAVAWRPLSGSSTRNARANTKAGLGTVHDVRLASRQKQGGRLGHRVALPALAVAQERSRASPQNHGFLALKAEASLVWFGGGREGLARLRSPGACVRLATCGLLVVGCGQDVQ